MDATRVQVSDEVVTALDAGHPVVALESTLIAHGLPRPDNLAVVRRLEDEVRQAGAAPATVAVIDGVARIGLDEAALTAIASTDVAKASRRDLAFALASGRSAATTVAATAALAASVGIRVFATGGLGGVHRGDPFDESADLTSLATTRIVLVCSGVKSILDVRATLERLETLGVAVAGYRTDTFPGSYLRCSGEPVGWRLDSADEVAAVVAARSALGDPGALVLANPIAPDEELDRTVHDRVLADALGEAHRRDLHGPEVTPFLLERFHEATEGASLSANIALVIANVRLAAEVAGTLR